MAPDLSPALSRCRGVIEVEFGCENAGRSLGKPSREVVPEIPQTEASAAAETDAERGDRGPADWRQSLQRFPCLFPEAEIGQAVGFERVHS